MRRMVMLFLFFGGLAGINGKIPSLPFQNLVAPPAAASNLPAGFDADVVRVVDGDTVVVSDGTTSPVTVRLIGVDTPETKHPTEPDGCFGAEAAAITSRMLMPGTGVRLSFDQDHVDDYGRALVYLYRSSDAMFVNAELLTAGAARTLRIEPNSAHATEFAMLESAAQASGAGLWGSCP